MPTGPVSEDEAKAALKAYEAFLLTSDQVLGDPNRDWTREIAAVATGPAREELAESVKDFAELGYHTEGRTKAELEGGDYLNGVVTATGCIDGRSLDVVDAQGNSIRSPDVSGTYYRHRVSVQVIEGADHQWRVVHSTHDRTVQC